MAFTSIHTWMRLLSVAIVPVLTANRARSGGSDPESASASRPPKILLGNWKGHGRIVGSWTSQRELPVDLTIASDGSVTGAVGDATIASGHFVENRGGLVRLFVHSDFSLVLELSGVVLKGDGIVRKRYRLNLNFHDPALVGFGASEGSKSFPGASRESMAHSMMLQVTDVDLQKVQ